jgi:4a-hydroxytetrahydrobiopterin dehydratase
MAETKDVVLEGAALEKAVAELPGWEMRDGWLRRKYVTHGWQHTLMLTNAIGYVAEMANHHPDLELGYAQVVVKLQTHRVKGITTSDTEMAKKIEKIATWKAEAPFPGNPKMAVK